MESDLWIHRWRAAVYSEYSRTGGQKEGPATPLKQAGEPGTLRKYNDLKKIKNNL